MNKMAGIALMLVGIVMFIIGLILYNRNPNIAVQTDLQEIIDMAIADGVLTANERELIKKCALKNGLDDSAVLENAEKQMTLLNINIETEIIDYNKKNGDDFEKFIVKKFSKIFFNVKEWAGDKYIDGIFADTTQQPDILFEFRLHEEANAVEFSVECKWRKEIKDNTVQIADKKQLERYKQFEKKRGVPVFIALGVGGTGNSPEQLYIIPLKIISSNLISQYELIAYKKNIKKDFYFDAEKKTLK